MLLIISCTTTPNVSMFTPGHPLSHSWNVGLNNIVSARNSCENSNEKNIYHIEVFAIGLYQLKSVR